MAPISSPVQESGDDNGAPKPKRSKHLVIDDGSDNEEMTASESASGLSTPNMKSPGGTKSKSSRFFATISEDDEEEKIDAKNIGDIAYKDILARLHVDLDAYIVQCSGQGTPRNLNKGKYGS